MIRHAARKDIPRLVEMGLRFVDESSYRGRLEANAVQMMRLMDWLIDDDDGLLLVSEREGKIVGMLGAFIYTQPISGERIAGEAFWWMEPEHRKGGDGLKLARTLEDWGRSRGAERATLIAPTEDVGRVCAGLGYGRLETHYQKDL